MKKIFALSALILSLNVLANDAEKFVCQEYDGVSGEALQRTVVLIPLSKEGYWNGDATVYQYKIEIWEEQSSWQPQIEAKGQVLTEDVYFGFQSEDESIQFTIYLDEVEDSRLSIKGEDIRSYFNCR